MIRSTPDGRPNYAPGGAVVLGMGVVGALVAHAWGVSPLAGFLAGYVPTLVAMSCLYASRYGKP